MEKGTPEYQQAYDAEMERLEAGAIPAVETPKPEVAASSVTTEQKPAEEQKAEPDKPVETETEKLLRLELERTKRALRGQSQSVSKMARKLDEIQRTQQTNEHKAQRPAILDQVDGLESAIQHVSRAPTQRTELPADQPFGPEWVSTVARGVPDVDALLADPQFNAKAAEMRDTNDWTDPVTAIRDLHDLKQQHVTQRAVNAASDQARKDYEARHQKQVAMKVPGGSGGQTPKPSTKTDDDEVKRWENMPSEEFQKATSKVVGYG